ncbi:uncharacterized protein MONOS_4104 [Monocercomonoides exilis]|uniref:uncharacterized protein n=1 Tax=Monocercomonoides exilis TaxID=2049356 RepID=UPI003559B2A4|nr:hypothetical protein MONOS_4104 [Monocercomonoides exilis]
MDSLTENVLAEADDANEIHPPLVAVCWGSGRGEDTAGGGGSGGDVGDVGGVEGEGICEGGEVEDTLAVEGETGDCCVVEGEGASSEEEEVCFYCHGGCSGDGGCVEVEGRGVIGEVEEDGGDLICGVVCDGESRDCEGALKDVDDEGEDEEVGWGIPLEAMMVAVVPFPVIFVFGARNVRVFVGVNVEWRRISEASLKKPNP